MFQMISKGISHKDFSLGFQNYEVFFFFFHFYNSKTPVLQRKNLLKIRKKNIFSLFKIPKPLFSNDFFLKQPENTLFRCLEL